MHQNNSIMVEQKCSKSDSEIAKGKFVWMLIQGCTSTINNIRTSKKKGSKDNNYLTGMALDTANMEFFINRNARHHHFYIGISSNNSITIYKILNHIRNTCKYARYHKARGVQIYYTGHSEINTGNWILNDGIITFNSVINIIIKEWGNQCFDIFCDCDYSGNWARELYKYTSQIRLVSVHGACYPGKLAYDSANNGGYFTLVQSGRKADHQLDKLNRCEASIDSNNEYSMTYWTPNGPKKMKVVLNKKNSKQSQVTSQ
eukprot:10123_1